MTIKSTRLTHNMRVKPSSVRQRHSNGVKAAVRKAHRKPIENCSMELGDDRRAETKKRVKNSYFRRGTYSFGKMTAKPIRSLSEAGKSIAETGAVLSVGFSKETNKLKELERNKTRVHFRDRHRFRRGILK